MPRRRQVDTDSNRSTSRTPTDASGEPLPAPTTLLSHVLGSRVARTASRTSRSSSTPAQPSRSSSRAPHPEVVSAPEPELENGQAGPSNLNGESHYRSTRPAAARRRRRAYSIRDEIDDFQPSTSPPSTTESEGYASPETSPTTSRPSPKRKRHSAPKRASRRRKLNNSQPLEVHAELEAGPSTLPSNSTQVTSSDPDVEIIPLPGETALPTTNGVDKIEEISPVVTQKAATSVPAVKTSFEPLAEYTCPICFSTPTNATMTPCGHVCCGECLFTAVKSTLQRAVVPVREPNQARCPVCRAVIKGWDGRGGGVVGLKPRSIISL